MMRPVSKTPGTVLTPSAVRATRPGWRDPRLWIGIAIVATSVLLGAKLLGDADDSVAVWSVSSDMGAGDTVGEADVTARNIRFVQTSDADHYLAADEPLPAGATLTRDVGAGELLPRSAIGTGSETSLRTLTFEFAGPGVPAGLAQGDRVEVYVTSVEKGVEKGRAGKASSTRSVAQLALTGLVVTDLARADASLAGSGGREVTVGIPADADDAALLVVVQAAKTDNIYLVKQG
jgi:hypothetical protein